MTWSQLFSFVFQTTLALRQPLHSNSLSDPPQLLLGRAFPFFGVEEFCFSFQHPQPQQTTLGKALFPHLFDRHFINKFWGEVLRLWIGRDLALSTSDVSHSSGLHYFASKLWWDCKFGTDQINNFRTECGRFILILCCGPSDTILENSTSASTLQTSTSAVISLLAGQGKSWDWKSRKRTALLNMHLLAQDMKGFKDLCVILKKGLIALLGDSSNLCEALDQYKRKT